MNWAISKDFTFSAAHHLHGLPDGHQCARAHGHNYIVRITITASVLDAAGMVFDYGALAPLGTWIDDNLDHRDLNTAPALAGTNPTAENLAMTLHRVTRQVVEIPAGAALQVGVSETPKTWATYTA